MTEVRPGQVYTDNDKRALTKELMVRCIEGDKALVVRITPGTDLQIHTKIKCKRLLNKGCRGFTLKHDTILDIILDSTPEVRLDPDANLEEMLSLARVVGESEPIREGDAARLAELVQALDGWISKGGFLPKRWQKP